MTGTCEQAVKPEQATVQLLPAHSTPLVQLFSPQLITHELADLQSTGCAHPELPHSTRQGMPAGQCGVQSGVLQVMTHTPPMQVPAAASHAMSLHIGAGAPPMPAMPPMLGEPAEGVPPMLTPPAPARATAASSAGAAHARAAALAAEARVAAARFTGATRSATGSRVRLRIFDADVLARVAHPTAEAELYTIGVERALRRIFVEQQRAGCDAGREGTH
jgi:hypothetical protein